MERKCFLKCLLNSHPPITLPHNTDIRIGRSKITKIKDQSCSRQQLSLKADCEKCTVEVKQLGINPSGLDGFCMKRSAIYKVGHGTKIEVLINNYIHIIEFDPPPESYDNLKVGLKRKLTDVDLSSESNENLAAGSLRKQSEENSYVKKKKVLETNDENMWEDIDNSQLYIYTSKGVQSKNKIAAFDMDGTLIKTKSGKVHPVDTNDWQIIFPVVSGKLKDLIENDFRLVIFSNQASIGNGKMKIECFKKKIEGIVATLGVPMQVYIATGKSMYRKPMIGMWQYLVKKKNDGLDVDMTASFYCGDAAGRITNWAPGKKKDHSMADMLFAKNINITFYTPEQYFLNHSVSNAMLSKPEFDPNNVATEPFNNNLISQEQEVLVLVGFPGSGKSFLARQIEQKSNYKYATVCRDLLGSWQKCAAKLNELLKQGKSVIVDCTNPDVESRSRWISAAEEMRVACRCARMLTSLTHALHNNRFRELMKTKHTPVSDIIFHSYKNKFTVPTISEGFKEVIDVKFSPNFEDTEAEKLYRMYLLEK